MLKILSIALAATSLASTSTAQIMSFDGVWARIGSTCTPGESDDVPMRISGVDIRFYESRCEMTNPVNIRDMNGQLFDMVCFGEGEEWTFRGLLLLNEDQTLVYSRNGWTDTYQRCK